MPISPCRIVDTRNVGGVIGARVGRKLSLPYGKAISKKSNRPGNHQQDSDNAVRGANGEVKVRPNMLERICGASARTKEVTTKSGRGREYHDYQWEDESFVHFFRSFK